MKGVSESLAGRVGVVNLLGLAGRKCDRRDTDVESFLPTAERIEGRRASSSATALKRVYRDIWLGSYPALRSGRSRNRDLFFASYLETYIQRDGKDLSQIGDEAAFSSPVAIGAALPHNGALVVMDFDCILEFTGDGVCDARPFLV